MGNGSGNDRLDAVFDRFADAMERVVQRVEQAGAQGGSGGGTAGGGALPAAAAPSVPSMGLEGLDLGGIADAALSGAGRGIGKTPPGALGSPDVLAQNGAIGAVGSVLDATIGNVPIIGDMISAQFKAFESAVQEPAQRAGKGVGRQLGNLAALGYDVSDDIGPQSRQALDAERRRFKAQRQVERRVQELNAQDGISFGLSSLGF